MAILLGLAGSRPADGQTDANSAAARGPQPTAAQLVADAWQEAERDRFAEAIRLCDEALKRDADFATAWYVRGRARFQAGQIKQSVSDFDRYVKLEPKRAPRQWERGIALYYAEQFREGAKQFELYQTYDGNDVENSVWRFLCLVPIEGVEKARQTMLPIEDDRRVPMMQIYRMYRGEMTPQQVLKAVEEDSPPADILSGRLFYARLYLGLYFEALGNKEQAKKFILLAADKHREDEEINHYMWSVADVHARRYRPNSDAKNGRDHSAPKTEGQDDD